MDNITSRINNFKSLGLGLFVHYGHYSIIKRGEWSLDLCKLDPIKYEREALSQDYSSINIDNIIDAALSCGAKYITLTSRHHDGFSLYDTKGLSDYDIMHTPNGFDLIDVFTKKCRENKIIPFIYHTTLDWHNPLFNDDFDKYLDYLNKSVEILCTNYGEIGGLWFDGNWSKPDADWKDDELYATIRRHQPNAIIINNTGLEAQGVLSNKEIDVVTFEQGKPTSFSNAENERAIGGEMCLPLNEHWGIAEKDFNFKSVKTLLDCAITSRRYEANFLIGVSPDECMSLSLIQRGLLEELGKWIKIHSEAFFNSKPTKIIGNKDNFVLKDENFLYAFICDVKTWGNENVMRNSTIDYAVFENFNYRIESVSWCEDDSLVDYTLDPISHRLIIKPTPFSYGDAQIIRVLKIKI
jgi:alpha-L-fucosidase